MKKVLIALYIMIVAAISVSARAANVDFIVTGADVDTSAQVIVLEGHFPIPCVGDPLLRAEIVEAQTISLRFEGPTTGDFCIQILGSPLVWTIDAAAI